jgi:hypothetical protein
LRLYALRDCTDQLRRLHGISIYIANRERMGDIYIMTARAKDRTGREDERTGAVALGTLKGNALANALMKCETKAKRRVTLSIAGLGWLDETELETIPQRHVISNDLDPLPSGEGDPPAEQHPTADDITRLVETARAANVDLEAFGHDMRRLMELPESQKTTKKFLRETMTMAQYNTARAHYGEALRVIIEGDVPNHEPPSETRDASASEAVHATITEGHPVDPSPVASSSAPGPDTDEAAAAERDRVRLRAEVAQWDLRVPPEEVEHVIQHNPYSKARALLWKCRRQDTAA